jgi:tetratricopeptide (TPR) repeat protein
MNDIKGAIKDLNQAIIIRPHFANAYLLRGLARLELNDYASALRDFDQTLKLDPRNAYAYTNRGIVKQKLEDNRGAIMDYNLALQIDPTIANAYMNRGIARQVLKLPGSDEDFAIAARLDPKFAFNPNDVDSRGLAQANQSGKQNQQQNPSSGKNSGSQVAQNSSQKNNNTSNNPAEPTQPTEQKPETKEERDRRRYRVALADALTANDSENKTVDDGRIQNKNIIIDLQPIFVLSSYDKYSNDFEHTQYYNLELETINNFNNYDPVVTISNKSMDHLREVFQNNILYFNERIKNNSLESQNYLSRGIFYSLTDDYTYAMNDLQKAIELNDKNALGISRPFCSLFLS